VIEILFLAWNRLEFTRASLAFLLANTDWRFVDRLCVYDDGSEDGTRELLDELLPLFPVETILRAEKGMGPVAIMRNYVGKTNADWFAKVDNDVAVPPGWLDAMLGVAERNPDVELLGMEAGMTQVVGREGDEAWHGVYRFEPATNIGGVGLMKSSAFKTRPSLWADGRSGFTEWQHTNDPVRGWITPDLPVVLLDRLPFEPWLSLSAEYVAKGWQRPWQTWSEEWMAWAWQWMVADEVAA
jgi:glycosyltransferase involved in cell wall biosynthesis